MPRSLLAALAAALLLSGCGGYRSAWLGSTTDLAQIDDSPADIRACRRLGWVSGKLPSVPGFGDRVAEMVEATRAKGGTDLYLRRLSRDWSYVRGEAYRCGDSRFRPLASTTVIRVRY